LPRKRQSQASREILKTEIDFAEQIIYDSSKENVYITYVSAIDFGEPLEDGSAARCAAGKKVGTTAVA